jgi:hypothetical protein
MTPIEREQLFVEHSKFTYTDEVRPWKELAAGIIIEAAKDYRAVQKLGGIEKLKAMHRKASKTEREKLMPMDDAKSAVYFFDRPFYQQLCGILKVNPEAIWDRINRDASKD